MKIVFLCGSLEPGRDGVGDYTRRLSGELIRQNNQVVIIALNDRQLKELGEWVGTQQDEEQSIQVLRLSAKLHWNDRIRRANSLIQGINPDWISLQYVPFSFHDKGLHFGLHKLLKRLCNGRKVQIMFHELWVGMAIQASTYHVWWGRVQRYFVRSLLTTLRPDVVHTHTHLYQIQLSRLGNDALLLPLISNIPLLKGLYSGPAQSSSKARNKLRFVFFGSIYPGSPGTQFAKEVAAYSSKINIEVDLTIIGRNGVEQEIWASAWRSHSLFVHTLGEQSPERISDVLRGSSIGLSTTPIALSGKSGSIAAMHAHGLPVLCVSKPWLPRCINEWKPLQGTFEYALGNLETFMANYLNIHLPSIKVTDVTEQFIKDLLVISTENATNACR